MPTPRPATRPDADRPLDHSLQSGQGRRAFPAVIAQGRYRLTRIIATGGMGAVFRAHDTRLDREVAVKRMLPHSEPEDRARFLREARTAARLRHPNVVAVHDCGVDEQNVPYLVMDLIDGESLADRLERGPLPTEEAAATILAITEALAAAHAEGILHRDLKPANILLSATGPLLTDFGLARRASDPSLTDAGTLVGTPQYMAPEQARSEELDARTDVYGIGACLYELLGGRPPFLANSAVSVLISIVSDAPPPLTSLRPDLDPALAAIAHRCLAKAPADRYATASALADDLRAWSKTAAPDAPADPKPEGGLAGWAIGGLALLVGLLAVTLAWVAREPAPPEPSPPTPTTQEPPQAPTAASLLEVAQAQRSRGERDEALATIADGLKAAGSDVERARLHALRGDLHGEAKAFADQRREYDRALELDPTRAETWYRRAEARVELREYQAAFEDLQRTLELDPKHARAYADRANVRALLKRSDGNLEDLETAVRLDPKHPWAWGGLGIIRLKRGDTKGALAAFDKGVALGTDEARVRLYRGTLRANLGNLRGAIDDFTVVLGSNRKHRRALYNRADLLLQVGEPKKALVDLDLLAGVAPRWAEAFAMRGVAHKRLGRPAQAVQDQTRALRLKARFPFALRERAECYARLGKRDAAIADYRRVLQLQPNSAQDRRRLEELLRGR